MNTNILQSSASGSDTLLRKINWRLVLFFAVAGLPLFWIGYTYVVQVITGGVQSHGDYASVDLKALGNFSFDDEGGNLTDVPARFRELNGKRVALEGMMWSTGSAGDTVSNCQLVYNIQKCCFNGPPRIQERVFLFGDKGQRFPFFGSMVRVLGKLQVRLKTQPGGKVISVYDLTVESVTPLT
jgi:hypothetical protein